MLIKGLSLCSRQTLTILAGCSMATLSQSPHEHLETACMQFSSCTFVPVYLFATSNAGRSGKLCYPNTKPDSLISHRRVSRFLTSVRSNYETRGLLENFSKCLSFVDFQFYPISPAVM